MIKHLFNVQAAIVKKEENFILPDNLVKYSIHLNGKYIDEYFKKYIDIDFKKEKLMIMYLDPNREYIKCYVIFDSILQLTGITREQIESDDRSGNILFKRQLFHYFYMKANIGSLNSAGKQTKNHHSTVINSLKVVNNCIEYGNGWHKKTYEDVFEDLKNKGMF